MRISVVIPTYRRHEALARTLDALEAQTLATGAFEVVVVDDPVDDDSGAVSAAARSETRTLRIRHLHRDARGVSAARNTGWRAAAAPIVLFLGDDILAAPDLLAEHLDWHGRRGGAMVGVLGHVRWADEIKTTPFMRWLEHGYQFNYPAIAGDRASWADLYTANVSIPRTALETVGGFDEVRFPFLYEDLDLGYRLDAAGFALLYNAQARAEHLHPTTIDDWRRRMAATATAERVWTRHRPEMPAYFRDRFADAAARPASRGRAARMLRWVGPGTPVLGPPVWRRADVHFRQQLAPSFLRRWEQDATGPPLDSPP